MAHGRKTGGRQKGTPNRATMEVQSRLEQLGCDPIEGMARLAMDTSNSPELRGRLLSELIQYVAPKRRAIEVNADQGERVTFYLGIPRRQPENPALPEDGPSEGPADREVESRKN